MIECPNCGFPSPADMRFCGMCGAKLKVVCGACGFANPYTYRFCGQCGSNLISPPQPDREMLSEGEQPAVYLDAAAVPEVSSPETQARLPASVSSLEGERRLATVILADVQGSTNLLETLGTEVWVELMNRIFQVLEAEIYRFGGEIDQFRGDGLVAFFGATLAHEDDPERAVLAGLAMQRAMLSFATNLAETQGIELRLRVGINTGEVIVANIGERSQYSEDTAMGEAIALASRMETSAEPDTVLVSENTYNLVRTMFEWLSLGQITVKGISHPVAVYRPLEPAAGVQRPLRLKIYGLTSRLVGRKAQFETLREAVERLYTRQGGVVLLTGEEGMGKTELIRAVRERNERDRAIMAKALDKKQILDLLPAPIWLWGRCRSYDQNQPYAMWLDMLYAWLGDDKEMDSESKTSDRLYERLAEIWGDEMDELYPYLATFMALSMPARFSETLAQLDEEAIQQRILFSLRKWLEAMIAQGPLILVFDDVHWADSSSMTLLEHSVTLCDQAPVLLIVIRRRERDQPLSSFCSLLKEQYAHLITELELFSLTLEQSTEMLDNLVGARALPPELSALIVDKAEGNPYYIEELVQSLILRGVLVRDEQSGHWLCTRRVETLDLPDTVRSLLQASMEALSAQERHILQVASVIGLVFWENVLADLLGEDGDLTRSLTALRDTHFIRAGAHVRELGREYTFHSNMLRQVASEGLLSPLRGAYHLKVAEYLEQFFGLDMLPRYFALLAYHYRQAGEHSKELFYTQRAAEQARSVYGANEEALRHYARAMELLDEIEATTEVETRLYVIRTQRFEVLNGRRSVLLMMGNYRQIRRDAKISLHIAQLLDDDPTWMIDALLQQPGVAFWRTMDQLENGLKLSARALDLARKIDDQHRELACLGVIAGQLYELHDQRSEGVAHDAIKLARDLEDKEAQASLLAGVGGVYMWTDQQEKGAAYLREALTLSQDLDDKRTEVRLLELMGMQAEREGDYYRLLNDYHYPRLDIARQIKHLPLHVSALMHCGQISSLYLGDYEGGDALLSEAEQFWQRDRGDLFIILRRMQIMTELGQYTKAIPLVAQTQELAEERINDMAHVGQRMGVAHLYVAIGNEPRLNQALVLCDEVCTLVTERHFLTRQYEMSARCLAAQALLKLAGIIQDCARCETYAAQALAASTAALDLYRELGGVQIIECRSEAILFTHCQALNANGQREQGQVMLEQAHCELLRKHALIPEDSPFSRTYLENIPLHRRIRAEASQEHILSK